MSERLGEELRILKLITNAFFERVHEGDRSGRAARLLFVDFDRGNEIDSALQNRIMQRRRFLPALAAPLLGRLRRFDLRIGPGEERRFIEMGPIGLRRQTVPCLSSSFAEKSARFTGADSATGRSGETPSGYLSVHREGSLRPRRRGESCRSAETDRSNPPRARRSVARW